MGKETIYQERNVPIRIQSFQYEEQELARAAGDNLRRVLRPRLYVVDTNTLTISETDQNESTNKVLPFKREVVGSKAFNAEYFSYSTRPEIRKDIITYLQEYR